MQIIMGAMAPTIRSQIKRLRLNFDEDTVKHFQKDMEAISRVKIRGLLVESEGNKSYDRLLKKVEAHLKELNK